MGRLITKCLKIQVHLTSFFQSNYLKQKTCVQSNMDGVIKDWRQLGVSDALEPR